jgi:hypothetical protein
MTRKEFGSAVMRLVDGVGHDPDPNRIVVARPLSQLYLGASGTFTRGPSKAFALIMKALGIDVGDAGPAEFIRWLGGAPEQEIIHVIDLLREHAQDWRESAMAFADGPQMRDLWRLRYQVAQTNDKASADRSKGGLESSKDRMEVAEKIKTEVLRLVTELKPKPRSRLQAARKIWTTLLGTDFERSEDRIYKILTDQERGKNFVRRELSPSRI